MHSDDAAAGVEVGGVLGGCVQDNRYECAKTVFIKNKTKKTQKAKPNQVYIDSAGMWCG